MAYFSFLYSQLFVEPPVPEHDFTGQTIIVTGANKGLGLEAARHLLRLNASKVILAVRSLHKGNLARADLEASTARRNAVHVYELDMASHASVKRFVQQMKALDRLDGVILNAGIYTQDFGLADGYESTITVNVINTFFLALLLVPVLRESSTRWNNFPRISIVSSDRHAETNLPEWKAENTFHLLNDEKKSNMNGRYFTSKLMQILLARALAGRLRGRPSSLQSSEDVPEVIVNTLTPGYCASDLTSNAHRLTAFAFRVLAKVTARTPEVGARCLVAGVSKGPESHGTYINDGKVDESALSPFVRSQEGSEAQQKLWSELIEILTKICPDLNHWA